MYIEKHMWSYICVYIENTYTVREQNCISESEGSMGSGRAKENVREWKILKQPIYIWI
jgi:hypothetical protein